MYNDIFKALPDPILLLDTDGTILNASDKTGEVLKCEISSLIGSNIDHLIGAKHQQIFGPYIEVLMTGKTSTSVPFSVLFYPNDDDCIILEVTLKVIPRENDHAILLKFLEPMMVNPVLHETLKVNNQLRKLVDNMIEGVQIIDQEWKYVYLNDIAVQHSRHSREDLIGFTMIEKYPGIENTELFRVLKNCIRDNEPHQMENEFNFPDGGVGYFQLSIQPIDGMLFILSVDITELKNSRMRLEKTIQGLKDKNLSDLKFQSQWMGRYLNPDLIVNAMNSADQLLSDNKYDEAQFLIRDLCNLMEIVLDESKYSYVSLSSTVNLLKLYLQLETKRLNQDFSFDISISDEINAEKVMIPPMLLQSFVEKGLQNRVEALEELSKVNLNIVQDKETLICNINVDGSFLPHLEHATPLNPKVYSESRFSFIHIVEKRLKILEQLEGQKYSYEIKNLADNIGNLRRTNVKVEFPLIEAR